jgi:DNA polymerase III epsilon subunit-like protein
MMLDQALTKMFCRTSTAGSPITRSQSRKHALKTPRVQGRNKRKTQNQTENPDEFLPGFVLGTESYITPVVHFADDDFDVSHTIYVVFDLETTGFSKERNFIIEIAAEILDHHGNSVENATFSSFVKPPCSIPTYISDITGIYDDDVKSFPTFHTVGTDFVRFIVENKSLWEETHFLSCDSIVFVAHNGKRFDVPFLFNHMKRHQVEEFDQLRDLSLVLDTMELAKKTVQKLSLPIPDSYKLSSLYYYITNTTLAGAHRAHVDVSATVELFRYEQFYNNRCDCICKVNLDGLPISRTTERTVQVTTPNDQPNDDSDTDDGEDEESQRSTNEEVSDGSVSSDEEEPLGYHVGWHEDTDFVGVDTTKLFTEEMARRQTRSTTNEVLTTGLQVSKNSVNSPLKAWKAIFSETIWKKIVSYTNEYGEMKSDNWQAINKSDIIDFICCLFIASVQKRKDKTSNWWSDDPLLENVVLKKLISGRKFHTVLRFLHVSSIKAQPRRTDPNYDPMYKCSELLELLESRYKKCFVPGQNLSLDESLIRAFGRIKFKVRIITKSARYGIKIYVLTDAETAFVLKVIVYTGKTTYGNELDFEGKKTIQVVNKLVEQYAGSFRTIYIDRFYTSIDLLKAMDKINIFVTGTCMKNRIPRQLTIAKSSREFKGMERGQNKRHLYSYNTDEGESIQYGLVCWKDRDIVYCLTSCHPTGDESTGSCVRRSSEGLKLLQRPAVIGEYNKYMGGVDLADMRRLHCNSTIMGQNRWWLKIFFYLLDVGTANALVLYREALIGTPMFEEDNKISIAEFKRKLIMSLVGPRLAIVERPIATHELVRTPRRHLCAYCGLYSKFKRTRYKCGHPECNIPLCSMGTGKSEVDCFALSHANESIRVATQKKYEVMQKRTNSLGK